MLTAAHGWHGGSSNNPLMSIFAAGGCASACGDALEKVGLSFFQQVDAVGVGFSFQD